MDLFGPLPQGFQKETWIPIVEDGASRWIELFPLTQATGEAYVRTLVNEVIMRFGVPRQIISDNRTQFISDVFIRYATV